MEQMCETTSKKDSSLEALEKKSSDVLVNVVQAKERLSSLLRGLKPVEPCDASCDKDSVQAINRISDVQTTIERIDYQTIEFNQIIAELEEILK